MAVGKTLWDKVGNQRWTTTVHLPGQKQHHKKGAAPVQETETLEGVDASLSMLGILNVSICIIRTYTVFPSMIMHYLAKWLSWTYPEENAERRYIWKTYSSAGCESKCSPISNRKEWPSIPKPSQKWGTHHVSQVWLSELILDSWRIGKHPALLRSQAARCQTNQQDQHGLIHCTTGWQRSPERPELWRTNPAHQLGHISF